MAVLSTACASVDLPALERPVNQSIALPCRANASRRLRVTSRGARRRCSTFWLIVHSMPPIWAPHLCLGRREIPPPYPQPPTCPAANRPSGRASPGYRVHRNAVQPRVVRPCIAHRHRTHTRVLRTMSDDCPISTRLRATGDRLPQQKPSRTDTVRLQACTAGVELTRTALLSCLTPVGTGASPTSVARNQIEATSAALRPKGTWSRGGLFRPPGRWKRPAPPLAEVTATRCASRIAAQSLPGSSPAAGAPNPATA